MKTKPNSFNKSKQRKMALSCIEKLAALLRGISLNHDGVFSF